MPTSMTEYLNIKYSYTCSSQAQLQLFEIHQLIEKRTNLYRFSPSSSEDDFNSISDDLIRKAYKKLGQINSDNTHVLIDLDEELKNSNLEGIKRYLGDILFFKLMELCSSKGRDDREVSRVFLNEAIKWLILNLNHDAAVMKSVQTTVLNHENEFEPPFGSQEFEKGNLNGFESSFYRQQVLRNTLDDDLCETLAFRFDGNWEQIDYFCMQAIKMQVPVDLVPLAKKNNAESS
jgi:hypothetical protein